MSYGSEYLAENYYEHDQAIAKWEEICIRAMNNASHGLWITKDGRYLHVSEMETSHIENCIRMLERNNSPFKKYYIPMFENELRARKDGDTDES